MKKVCFLLFLTVFVWSCSEDKEVSKDISSGRLPETFTIDIPSTLSNENGLSGGRLAENGELSGNLIYSHLRGFIYVGEEAAQVLQKIITVVGIAQKANVGSFVVISEEDGRSKSFTFRDDVSYDGASYAHEMTVDDEDGSRALQVVWNTNPVNGIAILNPFYINRLEGDKYMDTHYRLDYEESDDNETQTMTISVDGFPKHDELNKLKMTVKKTGDIYEVYGNSNHPNLTLINENLTTHRNYAFVARADDANAIAVAEVALPPSTIKTHDVMDDYSLLIVFDAEIKSVGITDQEVIDGYLANAVPPAYFDKESGFLGAGESIPEITGFTTTFIDLSNLSPYVPNDISNMSLDFLE